MIEVFKTNVQNETDTTIIIKRIQEYFHDHQINFDLEDCDKILRIEANKIESDKIIELLNIQNFECVKLE
ncbi:hypothetical protein OIU80_14535 [Flavobacterium sp. LS1R47]|uniref:Methyltransferase type 11 n=1 Tax=Flavobacterium frigoritolerans TaxID=2987686 RepID=A0A9X2ZRG8_9FLAO|nr:hypothetical protein [Flavobacterium frigoritolerans]MCV9933501.1 hypothetical protein [Flavobacterium frigoritolerans]